MQTHVVHLSFRHVKVRFMVIFVFPQLKLALGVLTFFAKQLSAAPGCCSGFGFLGPGGPARVPGAVRGPGSLAGLWRVSD